MVQVFNHCVLIGESRYVITPCTTVHPMTHCDINAALSDQLPIKVSLERRCIRFINKCLSSSNSIVNVISHIAICNPISTAGKNYIVGAGC